MSEELGLFPALDWHAAYLLLFTCSKDRMSYNSNSFWPEPVCVEFVIGLAHEKLRSYAVARVNGIATRLMFGLYRTLILSLSFDPAVSKLLLISNGRFYSPA